MAYSPSVARNSGKAQRISLLDDVTLLGPASLLEHALETLPAVLARGGHRLQLSKSQAWCPCADGIPIAEVSSMLTRIFDLVPRAQAGVELLGGAATNEYSAAISRTGTPPSRTSTRYENARCCASELQQMAKQCHTNDTLHLTWSMCRGSLASALNYDAMIIPLERIQPHLDQVTQMVRNVVDTIAATRLSDDAHCAASLMPFFSEAQG